MYLRDGQPMGYPEEGAAFFEPIKGPQLGAVPPRTMGLNMDLLTRGFSPAQGIGDDAAGTGLDDSLPYLALLAGAIGGFMLWRKR